MRFTVLPSALAAAARTVHRAVDARQVLPILQNVCLTVGNDRLTLGATNLEIAIETTIPATDTGSGSITVPARALLDLASSASGGELSATDTGQTSLAITSGGAKYRLMGLAAEEFPALPEVGEENSAVLSANTAAAALRRVLSAVSQDPTRPILTGMLWSGGDGKLKLAATDTHRLAVETVTPMEMHGERSPLIPGHALAQLLAILDPKSKEPLLCCWDQNQIAFRQGRTVLVSRLIEGTFPKVERVIPTSHTTRAVVEVAAWREALARVRPFCDQERVHCSFGEGKLILHAATGDLGEANEELPAEVEGPEIALVLKAAYLADLLAVAPGERVVVEMKQPLAPVLFRPAEEAVDWIYVQMPMQLQ
jgi:DNA polymerase-3 subunit beta